MRLDLRGQIKQFLLEKEDPEHIHSKTITIYNYKGIPHSEGATLYYASHIWDFLTTFVVSYEQSVSVVSIKYKDFGDEQSRLRLSIINTNPEFDEEHYLLSCFLNKPDRHTFAVRLDECSREIVEMTKELILSNTKQLAQRFIGTDIRQLLPELFWKELYKNIVV
jgi:hypothetical protein